MGGVNQQGVEEEEEEGEEGEVEGGLEEDEKMAEGKFHQVRFTFS